MIGCGGRRGISGRGDGTMSCYITAGDGDDLLVNTWIGDMLERRFRPPAINEDLYDRTFAPQSVGMGRINLYDLSPDENALILQGISLYADELGKHPEGSAEHFAASELVKVVKLVADARTG